MPAATSAIPLIATGVSTLLVMILAVPASYALSIRPVKKTQDVLFFFISTKMLPVVAVIMPIYVIAGQLKVLDNIWTLVVLYTAMNLPIAVWMMRSFFQEVPGGGAGGRLNGRCGLMTHAALRAHAHGGARDSRPRR